MSSAIKKTTTAKKKTTTRTTRRSPASKKPTAGKKLTTRRKSPAKKTAATKKPARTSTGIKKSGRMGSTGRAIMSNRKARSPAKSPAKSPANGRHKPGTKKVPKKKEPKQKTQEELEEEEYLRQREANERHHREVNARLKAEREAKLKKEREEAAAKKAALTPDANNVLHVPLTLIREAMEVCWENGKTPLILDSTKRTDQYFTYSSTANEVRAKGVSIRIFFQKTPVATALEDLRKTLYASLKHGKIMVVNMEDGACDFKKYTTETEFPAKTVFTHGAVTEEKVYSKFIRDHEMDHGMFFVNDDFRVAMLSHFSLADYQEFLGDCIWLELMQVIEILE